MISTSADVAPATEDGAALAEPAIQGRGLLRQYGKVCALRSVDVTVPRAALCALIGPNGAGKTTLLSILATLDEEWEGEATVGGADVRRDPHAVRRVMGFVPDAAQIYEDMTVAAYLQFFAHAHGLPRSQRAHAVERVLDLTGLGGEASRPAAGLSKGMTQRLNVGRALLHDPDVLLLDEPAAGLDPRARIELKELLKKLQRRGKTVLISSHILTELGDFCDRVVVVEKGRIAASGAISELWDELHGQTSDVRRVLVEVLQGGSDAAALLNGEEAVLGVAQQGDLMTVEVQGGPPAVASLVRLLVDRGFGVVRVGAEKENLEALFLTVTRGEVQ